jgi:DNA-binding GntR family transcriptional regulator
MAGENLPMDSFSYFIYVIPVKSELSKENLEDILKLRINLECMAARKAVQSKNADLLDRLNIYHKQFLTASVYSYHQEIINAARNNDPEAVSHWIEADLTDSTRFILSIFDASE